MSEPVAEVSITYDNDVIFRPFLVYVRVGNPLDENVQRGHARARTEEQAREKATAIAAQLKNAHRLAQGIHYTI